MPFCLFHFHQTAWRKLVTKHSETATEYQNQHWLTPANLDKFDRHFTNYFSFGCSAMTSAVGTGMLRGRSFGPGCYLSH